MRVSSLQQHLDRRLTAGDPARSQIARKSWEKLERAMKERRTEKTGLAWRMLSNDTWKVTTKSLVHSILEWLRAGYPQGVPGPDRVPLLALLRNTPLTEDQVKEVVREISDEEAKAPTGHEIDDDEIEKFIEGVTHHDAGPENVRGWRPHWRRPAGPYTRLTRPPSASSRQRTDCGSVTRRCRVSPVPRLLALYTKLRCAGHDPFAEPPAQPKPCQHTDDAQWPMELVSWCISLAKFHPVVSTAFSSIKSGRSPLLRTI